MDILFFENTPYSLIKAIKELFLCTQEDKRQIRSHLHAVKVQARPGRYTQKT